MQVMAVINVAKLLDDMIAICNAKLQSINGGEEHEKSVFFTSYEHNN